jgi:hypothetical protein
MCKLIRGAEPIEALKFAIKIADGRIGRRQITKRVRFIYYDNKLI